MKAPRPLNPTPTREVPLPNAPLARVIAQARFPAILSVRNPDKVAVFQEELREIYPHLNEEQVHAIELTESQTPNVRQGLIIWRLADAEQSPRWRVSLGVDFVSLETSDYKSRQDFLDRLRAVLTAVENAFKPSGAQRLGLRYIDRLTGEAAGAVADLIRPEVLGIIGPTDPRPLDLRDSIVLMMTEARFQGPDGNLIQGRWGILPSNTTYDPNILDPVAGTSWVLDLDMATQEPGPFSTDALVTTAKGFAESLYWLFRRMVTDEFLRFHGGKP